MDDRVSEIKWDWDMWHVEKFVSQQALMLLLVPNVDGNHIRVVITNLVLCLFKRVNFVLIQ